MAIFKIGIIPALAAVAGIGLTVALGNWQSGRAESKLELQRQLFSAAAIAPLELSPDQARTAEPASLRYRQVRLAGRWRAEGVVYLENRQHAGQAGFYVLMPLIMEKATDVASDAAPVVVIINRGWLPRNGRDRTAIAPYETPAGQVLVEGTVLENEPALLELAGGAAHQLGGLWQNFDHDLYASASGQKALRLIVRQNANAAGGAKDGLVREWSEARAPLAEQISKHRGYAFQWYALAALLAGLAVFFEIRKRRAPAPPDAATLRSD